MTINRYELTKEFYYKGDCTGILLIHGFTGTPSEMRYLGDFLKDKGFTVRGVLLKGHGTTPGEMKKCTYRDWISTAVDGYKSLKQECDEVHVVGLSMGGSIALYLARNFDVKSIICLSTPIKLVNKSTYMGLVVKFVRSKDVRRKIKKHMMFKCSDPYVIGYDKTPIKCMISLLRLIKYIRSNLSKIKKPVLIMQSYRDNTVNPKSANIIYNNIGSKDKSIVYLHRSGHLLTCDCEKDRVFDEIYKFISNRTKAKDKAAKQNNILDKESDMNDI